MTTLVDVKDQELGGVSGGGEVDVRYFCPKCGGLLLWVVYDSGPWYRAWQCQKCGTWWLKEQEEDLFHTVSGEF